MTFLTYFQFKERDFMEGIFKFWRNPDPKLFDVEKMWYVKFVDCTFSLSLNKYLKGVNKAFEMFHIFYIHMVLCY